MSTLPISVPDPEVKQAGDDAVALARGLGERNWIALRDVRIEAEKEAKRAKFAPIRDIFRMLENGH